MATNAGHPAEPVAEPSSTQPRERTAMTDMMDSISSWTERQIAAGTLSPGARGMTPAAAAEQYNAANALEPGDAHYLVAPTSERVRR